LVHEPGTGPVDRVLLPRFEPLRRCPGCLKWDEGEILQIGFDPDRLLPMPQDIRVCPNDLPWTVVSDRFRKASEEGGIEGLRFVRCGRSRSRGPLFVLWPDHETPCRAPVEQWVRGDPLPPGKPPYHACPVCGRPDQVVGFPPLASLDLPDPLTVSVPSVPTYMNPGRDFRFFCSDAVRQVLKGAGLEGCNFVDLAQLEKRFGLPQPETP
jgi:hypothetical protein